MRCALINGVDGIGKTTLLEELCQYLITSGNHLLISANGQECTTASDLLTHFTRNLISSQSLEINDALNSFARTVGGELLNKNNSTRSVEGIEKPVGAADFFVSKLSKIIRGNEVTPVIIIEDLELLSGETLTWLSTNFNKALRNSSQFKNCRFLFSSTKDIPSFETFWARFGMENPVSLALKALSCTEINDLALSFGHKDVPSKELTLVSKGIPALALKHLQNGFIMNSEKRRIADVSEGNNNIDLNSLPEKELEYLLYASYPEKINRYNLEHFCSPKMAAFTYNWLKRRQDLCEFVPGGDLVLKQSAKQQMRAFHLEQEPQKAEEMATLASVLDAFYDEFPDTENHWIPINLQAFNSFTKALCRKVFDDYENEQLSNFFSNYDHIIEKRGKFFTLSASSKQLINRYMELSGTSIKEDLFELVNIVWEADQVDFQKRKVKIELNKQTLIMKFQIFNRR